MENEREENIANSLAINSEQYFKLDYGGQSLKTNTKFQSWKKKMINIYGNRAKLFKCKNDNIYFYTLDDSQKRGLCPLCKNDICYFCSDKDYYCCIRSITYQIITEDGFTFINNKDEKQYSFIFRRFLFPIYTFCYLTAILSKNLFHIVKIETKKKRENNCFFDDESCACITSIILNAGVALILSLIFLLHDIYFKLLLILFSIFCKNYPLYFYLGIIKKGIDGLS